MRCDLSNITAQTVFQPRNSGCDFLTKFSLRLSTDPDVLLSLDNVETLSALIVFLSWRSLETLKRMSFRIDGKDTGRLEAIGE